ncbi:MAG: hypothetical protein ACREUU_12420 [Gammaproteobacteria bacterium]
MERLVSCQSRPRSPVTEGGLSPAAFKEGAVAVGIPDWYADALLNLYQLYVAGGAQRVTKDVERVTARKPRTFDEFAREHAAAFR